jgi:hypothetical protein
MAIPGPIGEAQQKSFRASPIPLCLFRWANNIGATIFYSPNRQTTTEKKSANFLYWRCECGPASPKGAASAPRFV